jgi:hypothetical protein
MARLFDRAGMSTTTTGTGTLTLGAALGNVSPNLAGFLSFAGAGATDGLDVSYLILDSNNGWEVGHGTYTASGTTLSRNVTKSSNANAAINLSGNAQVFITVRAEDLLQTDANGNITQAVNISNATASTSTTTGALQVTGGVGVQGDEWIGGNIALTSAAKAVVFNASGTGIGSAPAIGSKDFISVAVGASLGISSIGCGLFLFRNESDNTTALIIAGVAGASIIWQSSTDFTLTDPGPGGNKWFIQNSTGHYGDPLNRFTTPKYITYLLISLRGPTFV